MQNVLLSFTTTELLTNDKVKLFIFFVLLIELYAAKR